jgi:hypothetical protein
MRQEHGNGEFVGHGDGMGTRIKAYEVSTAS